MKKAQKKEKKFNGPPGVIPPNAFLLLFFSIPLSLYLSPPCFFSVSALLYNIFFSYKLSLPQLNKFLIIFIFCHMFDTLSFTTKSLNCITRKIVTGWNLEHQWRAGTGSNWAVRNKWLIIKMGVNLFGHYLQLLWYPWVQCRFKIKPCIISGCQRNGGQVSLSLDFQLLLTLLSFQRRMLLSSDSSIKSFKPFHLFTSVAPMSFRSWTAYA